MAYYLGVKQNKTQVEYTAYGTEYQVCLPVNLEIIIPSDEPVRLLNAVIEANANRYSFVWKTAVTKRQAKLREKIAEELPKLLEASATGIVAPYIITAQRLKKLRKCLYAKKAETNTAFVSSRFRV